MQLLLLLIHTWITEAEWGYLLCRIAHKWQRQDINPEN